MKYRVDISFVYYYATNDEEEAKKSIYHFVKSFLHYINISGRFKLTAEEIKDTYKVTKL